MWRCVDFVTVQSAWCGFVDDMSGPQAKVRVDRFKKVVGAQ